MKDIKIYSSKIARRLINEKFTVIDIEENTRAGYDGKTVFSFTNSKEIREFLKIIYKINIPENMTDVM